jgi:hypothetical protein
LNYKKGKTKTMIQKIKNKFLILASLLTLAVPAVVAPVAVYAAGDPNLVQANLCDGANFTVDTSEANPQAGCKSADGKTSAEKVNDLIRKIVNVISAIVGVVAVIMIVVGGFKYITSGGDSNNVSGAKNTIIYAIIGLVIVALAQLIVHFVLNQSSGLGGGDGADAEL